MMDEPELDIGIVVDGTGYGTSAKTTWTSAEISCFEH